MAVTKIGGAGQQGQQPTTYRQRSGVADGNHRNGIEDVRILEYSPLVTPRKLGEALPRTSTATATVRQGRYEIQQTLQGNGIAIYLGPCGIHDIAEGIEYADRVADLQRRIGNNILLVMRTYFEKPRTTVGWPGLLCDPRLDDSGDIDEGLYRARVLLCYNAEHGIPSATEFVDTDLAQFNDDLMPWGCVGARTTESQIHRRMASGMSMPIGFKNSTDGNVQLAVDGAKTSRSGHIFPGLDQDGRKARVRTRGNPYTHIVLRGGTRGPNYERPHVEDALALLRKAGLEPYLIVDCSHGNSNKDYKKQPVVFEDVIHQIVDYPQSGIAGLMLESNINEGRQNIGPDMKYGVSITDACLGWEDTERLIRDAARMLDRKR